MIAKEIGPEVRITDTLFADDEVHLSTELSTAVPGLVYYWGQRPPTSDHGAQPWALVAVRRGEARVLRVPGDWAALVTGWGPLGARDAIAACTEFVVTTLPRHTDRPVLVGPYTGLHTENGVSVVLADTVRQFADAQRLSRSLSSALFLSDSAQQLFRRNRARITAPEARTLPRAWEVALWHLRDLGARRYRCIFPRADWLQGERASFTLENSVPWSSGPATHGDA